MKSTPLISIVIPAYNADTTIIETLQSLERQTYSHWEAIVIDDGSQDQTVEKVQNFNHPQVKLFSYENGGVCTARNRGIQHAQGEYISFLDADDLWTADKLEAQLFALQNNPQAGVAYSWTYFFQRGCWGESMFRSESLVREGDIYRDLLIENFLHSGSNPLIHREVINAAGGFDPSLSPCGDWDFYLRLAQKSPFVLVRKHQIFYRLSNSSMSSSVERMKAEAVQVIEQHCQQTPSVGYAHRNLALSRLELSMVNLYLRQDSAIAQKKAQSSWMNAVRLNSNLLATKRALKLAMKLILKQFLPQQNFQQLVQLRHKMVNFKSA